MRATRLFFVYHNLDTPRLRDYLLQRLRLLAPLSLYQGAHFGKNPLTSSHNTVLPLLLMYLRGLKRHKSELWTI